PTDDLRRIREQLQVTPPPALTSDAWRPVGEGGAFFETRETVVDARGTSVRYHELEAAFPAPVYLEGTVPYAQPAEGGGFARDDAGQPVVPPGSFENLRLVLTLPDEPPAGGASCYPVVVYAHGTTGSAESFVLGTGARLAARGLAAVGLDQPLHGPRWEGSADEEQLALLSFNFLNPASTRTLQRQSVVDTFTLVRLLEAGLEVPGNRSPTGEPVCLDGERILFFGHSQGATTGAMAAAFEDRVDAWVLSGAGGGFGISLTERNDRFVDAQSLLQLVLGPAPGEALDDLHPVIGLLQHALEVTDALVYAPGWSRRPPGSPPASVFVGAGAQDQQVPVAMATALALAGGLPAVQPLPADATAFRLAGGLTDLPVQGNAGDGGRATVGFIRWDDADGPADHRVMFERPEAIEATLTFLESAARGTPPRLVRQPESPAR
ncbi:MAG TPA: hypothetical protein RMF84_09375, partial [Polyangiaceae bacterium LLY-WYZ-14_1]|nr:hypothetical protein [Polyangiaceae bacterium LLY-WYZ-14_1]